MSWRVAPLAGLLALVLAAPAHASVLYTGACELGYDPAEGADEELGLCLRGAVGAEVGLGLGAPAASEWLDFGSAYAGLFIASWLSFQGRGYWRNAEPLGRSAKEDKDAEVDYAVMQLGSPVLSHVRATVGRSRLPFGIDSTAAPQLYQMEENRHLWESPHDTGYLTLDDMRQVKLELGLATNDLDRRRRETTRGPPEPTENAGSFRASVDISALEGTRLISSGLGSKNGERRFGAGIINENRKGDQTQFEFIRRLTTPDGHSTPFDQLLRLGFVSSFQREGRWVFQLDDERSRFRRGLLDRDIRYRDHLLARFGLSYTKSEDGVSPNRWALLTGLEADL